MSRFTKHSIESTSDERREILESVDEAYGFVPNLMATMVEAPQAAKGYLSLGKIFGETSFSQTEQQVVLLTSSRNNGCEYCMAAHTTVAGMNKVDDSVVEAIRNDRPIEDSKLEALRTLVTKLHEKRGWLDDDDVQAFIDAGYGQQQVLEAVLGLAFKTLSNFTNHIAGTEVDDAFSKNAWTAPEREAA